MHLSSYKMRALALICLELLALTAASSANDSEEAVVPEVSVSGDDAGSRPVPLDLGSLIMGPHEARYPEVPPSTTPTSPKSNSGASPPSPSYFPERLQPSNVIKNFDRDNFMKVFTYDPAPELEVPQNESVAYLLQIMTEVNDNIDRLILQAAREVSEYYRQVLSASEDDSNVQNAPFELYDLVYKNLRALLGTLDDYPVLKESLYLWSSLEEEDEDDEAEEVRDGSSDGAAGRAFKFSKMRTTTPAPPRFVCPEHLNELVNCWSYDILDTVSDNAKYYLSPFTW